MRSAIALLAASAAGRTLAEGKTAGDFDYHVMALSQSLNWRAATGDTSHDDQRDAQRDLSFTRHGLWPKNESGWPSICRARARDPARSETAALADIMGGAGLARHEWQKHGRCIGLPAQQFLAAARHTYENIIIQDVFRNLARDLRLPARVVEHAFQEANPALDATMVTIARDQGMIEEARICLTRELTPRACGADTMRDCRMEDALREAVR